MSEELITSGSVSDVTQFSRAVKSLLVPSGLRGVGGGGVEDSSHHNCFRRTE